MVKSGHDVYLFCGEEEFLKEEASKKIISGLLAPRSKDLNCDIYNARDDYKNIFDTLNTFPFLSSKRVVIIKEIEYFPQHKRDNLLAYLKTPLKHILLILHTKETPLSDKFVKALSACAKTRFFNKLDMRELRDWIFKRLNQQKKAITKGALDLLLELKGSGDLALLSGELEKLVTYKADGKTIEEEDVIALVGKSVTKKTFDLADAIRFKDRRSALFIVRELSSGRGREAPEMLGLMGWQLRRLHKTNRLSAGELKRDFKLLVEADRDIKAGYNRPEFVLEDLVIKLCSA